MQCHGWCPLHPTNLQRPWHDPGPLPDTRELAEIWKKKCHGSWWSIKYIFIIYGCWTSNITVTATKQTHPITIYYIYIYSLLPYIAFIVFRLLKTFNCFFPNCNAAGGTSPLCFSCGFGKDNNHVAECTETRLPSRELTYRTFEKWKSSSNISFSRGYLSSQECNSYLFFFRDWLRITTTWGNFLVELPRLKPLLCYQLCCQCTAQAWQDTHGMGLALSQSTRKLPKKRQ